MHKVVLKEEGREGGEKKCAGAWDRTLDLPRARRETTAARHVSSLDK